MLKLIIADNDQSYIEALADYITLNYAGAFQAVCISNDIDFDEIKEKTVDIVLTSCEMLEVVNKYFESSTIILLNEGKIEEAFIGYSIIYKYMRADKIVSELFNIYSENNPGIKQIYNKGNKTIFICTYSASGGTGKSVISAALAIRFAQRGLRAFYLNLEELQSTSAFFPTNNEKNLSHVLYYLKENRFNLNMKFQALSSCDEVSNVHYFSALENALEYDEISNSEINKLIDELGELNFDYIFIDLTAGLDLKKLNILTKANILLNVSNNNYICSIKDSILKRNIEEIERRDGVKLKEKTINVINKSNYLNDEQISNSVEIPFEDDMQSTEGKINLSNKFGEAINDLSNRIIEFSRRGFLVE